MRRKRFLYRTAASLFAAVLLSFQICCYAASRSGMAVAREGVFLALEEIGLELSPPVAVSTLSESGTVDLSRLENACIIGHSHAVGMKQSLDLSVPDYIAEIGLTAETMLSCWDFVLPDGSVGDLKKGLAAKNYEQIYVLLGSNDIPGGMAHLPDFRQDMEELLYIVEVYQPKAEICLLSIAPIGESLMNYFNAFCGLTQETMDDYNYTLRSIAVDRGFDYLDITTPLSDASGFLAKEYDQGDGLHFTKAGNEIILNTILTHHEDLS